MRALTAVVVILAAIWGGYWFVGSSALKSGAEGVFQAQIDAGMIATRANLNVAGFPNRFDLTVEGLHLADPATGTGWSAPLLRLYSLSYTPWHWIAALPPSQVIDLPGQTLTITSGDLRGSLVLVPETALALDRIAVTGEVLGVKSSLGWTLDAQKLSLHSRQDLAGTNAHQVDFLISNIAPDAALMATLGSTDMPPTIESIHLNAVLEFSKPLNRFAGEAQPKVTSLAIKEGLIRWGSIALSAKGSLAPDANGVAEGRVDLRIEDWRKALAVAQAMGLVTPEVAPTWEKALAMLSEQSGTPNVLEMPLALQNGQMSLGFLPLGPAPSFRQWQ